MLKTSSVVKLVT